MSIRKYQYGIWNLTNSNFEVGKTNEASIKEVIKDAIDNDVNVLLVGGCQKCYLCDEVFKQISNMNSDINKNFLFKQRIYLLTYHQSQNGPTKDMMMSYINSAALAKKITFSYNQYTKSLPDAYSCHAVINMSKKEVNWVLAITSVNKNTIIKILGDNPIPVMYSVIFKDEDGTMLKSEQLVESGYDAIPPDDPSKGPNYAFIGWNPSETNITSDRICIAQYRKTKNTYKVTFKDEDGTILKGPIDVDEGATAPAPTPPSKSGKTFSGWNPSNVNIKTDTICVARYTSSSEFYTNTITKKMFYNNKSLQSISLPENVELIDDGAFYTCEKLNYVNIPRNCKKIGMNAFRDCRLLGDIDLSNVEEIGACAFFENFPNSTLTNPTRNIKFGTVLKKVGERAFDPAYENKSIKTFTTIFDCTAFNENSAIPSLAMNALVVMYKGNTAIIKFKDVATSSHFALNGDWSKYIDYFDPAPYRTISFNANGGSGKMDNFIVYPNEKWYCPDNAFNKQDCEFVEFNSSVDRSGNSYIPGERYNCPSLNLTLYAIWTKTGSISISFNSNGGSGNMNPITISPSLNSWTCPACTFSHVELKFAGYYTDKVDGSGSKYYPSKTYDKPASNMTLYAIWIDASAMYSEEIPSGSVNTKLIEEYSCIPWWYS